MNEKATCKACLEGHMKEATKMGGRQGTSMMQRAFRCHNKMEEDDYRNVHDNICRFLFDSAKNGDELWVKIESWESSDLDLETTYEDENNYWRVYIMTPLILSYDGIMFNIIREGDQNNIAKTIYAPYFFHFLIDKTELDKKSKDFLLEHIDQWVVGSFDDKGELKEGQFQFQGYVEEVGESVECERGTLVINTQAMPYSIREEINRTYQLQAPWMDKDKIEAELRNALGTPVFYKARIYNIGNGNCVYLTGQNEKGDLSIFYDIGYYCTKPSKDVKNPTYQASVREIRSLKPNCVILSHWDSDHYFGCVYANREVFRCKWFAPEIKEKHESAKKVAKYLQLLGNLVLIKRDSQFIRSLIAHIHTEQLDFKMLMGGKDTIDRKITECNKEGIILEILNGNSSTKTYTLMAGDVPYRAFPLYAMSQGAYYDYLIVPHHGAEMDMSVIQSKEGREGYAVICAKLQRPKQEHVNDLCNKGYKVEITGDKLCNNSGTSEDTFFIEIDLLEKYCVYRMSIL